MFREKYKATYSQIHGDRTQIDKIFSIAEKSSAPKKAKIYPLRYTGTLVAALAIVIAIAMYPSFTDFVKTEDTEFEPVGVVYYGLDKSFDNTVITGTVSEDKQADDTKDVSAVKPESAEKREDAAVVENKKFEANEKNDIADNAEATENALMASGAPILSMKVPGSSDRDEQETDEEDEILYAASMESSADFAVIEEIYSELGEGKNVTFSSYSHNNEIKAILDEMGEDANGYKLLIVSDSDAVKFAYAEKDGVFYKFISNGLNEEELKQFVSEKI